MKPRVVALVVLVSVAAAGAGVAWFWRQNAAPPPAWRTAPLARRDVQKVVSSTGILNADPSVDVGTQVSGIVAELLVDFNDKVEKGQVLARIDPTLLEADVASAEARLAEAQAQAKKSGADLRRMLALHERQAATDQELEASRATDAVAAAQVESARVTVARTRRNLGYATITAPVAGTIVKRSVNLGQTVNAGFSAPTLFTLANDLRHMIILANVDESDVGQVHEGQTATFTVQTYPERTFTGTVRQVRLDSRTEQGVVTYTTVVDVENVDAALFPGMTATVEFIVAEAQDILCAPNAALRFKPDRSMPLLGEVPEGAVEEAAAGPRGDKAGGPGGPPPGAASGGGRRKRGADVTTGHVWALEGSGIRAIPVTVGIRGAECSEVSGEGLQPDLPLVLGIDREGSSGGTASPFSRSGTSGPGKPGGF